MEQIAEAVHEKGSFIFAQLRAYGRSADPKVLEEEGPFPLVSASNVPLTGQATPRPLTKDGLSFACCHNTLSSDMTV